MARDLDDIEPCFIVLTQNGKRDDAEHGRQRRQHENRSSDHRRNDRSGGEPLDRTYRRTCTSPESDDSRLVNGRQGIGREGPQRRGRGRLRYLREGSVLEPAGIAPGHERGSAHAGCR